MAGRSQRHLRQEWGVDSAGDTFFPGPRDAPNFALAVADVGTDTVTVTVSGASPENPWTVTYTVQLDAETALTGIAPVAASATLTAIATTIAASVNAKAGFTATSDAAVVTITITGAETAITTATFNIEVPE